MHGDETIVAVKKREEVHVKVLRSEGDTRRRTPSVEHNLPLTPEPTSTAVSSGARVRGALGGIGEG